MILAINSGIGSSVGLFDNGSPIICLEEERFNRIKNYMGFPKKSLNFILNNHVDVQKIEYVSLCNKRGHTINREIFYSLYKKSFLQGWSGIIYDLDYLKIKLRNLKTLQKVYNFFQNSKKKFETRHEVQELINLGFQKNKILNVEHHECHAASAYYGLAKEFDSKYLIFTSDGGGDQTTSSVWIGEKGLIKKLSSSNCYSLGNIYSMTTHFLGFKSHEHEYKIMGLAPYSKKEHIEKYAKFFERFLDLKCDDTIFFNPKTITHSIFANELKKNFKNDRFDNISGGLQLFAERITERWIKGNIKKYGVSKILGSGGTFMNVKINMNISSLTEVSFVDIFPSCGDESNIFGAAFSVDNKVYKNTNISRISSYYLGSNINRDLNTALKYFSKKIQFKVEEDINSFTAKKLAENKIIARCSGAMEFGARALGNRSILANPSNLKNVGIINRAIKNRDFWMPFAPMVMKNEVKKYLVIPDSLKFSYSRFMMFACDTNNKYRDEIICAVHQSDFTARPQIVDNDNDEIFDLLEKFYKITGIPVLLNTSYNLHGFPIVENSMQAVEVFLKTELDYLLIDNVIIWKKIDRI